MGIRKGISVTPNVYAFVVEACGQAELQVLTPQISVPDPFPTSIIILGPRCAVWWF